MKCRNLIFLALVTFAVNLVCAESNDGEKPTSLFTCTVKNKILNQKTDIAFVARGTEYQRVEGANLSHPTPNEISKPVFRQINGECIYQYDVYGGSKTIIIERKGDSGSISISGQILGECSFTKNIDDCKLAKEKGVSPAQAVPKATAR